MQLPTMSLRVAKEHQQLIRDIGLALRTRPELLYALRDVLQSQHVMHDVSQSQHSIALRDTDVLQSILDRIDVLEEREPRMVRMEALETRIAALEEWVTSTQAAPRNFGNSEVRPRAPRPAAGKRKSPVVVTDDLRRQVHDLRASGMTRDAVAKELEIGSSTVSRILDNPRPAD